MADVVVVTPHDRTTDTAQTPNMVRQAGIAPDTCDSKGLWMGYVAAPPGPSGAHHHGAAESGIYVLRGRVRMHFGERLGKTVDATAGDFIYVPPNTVHVEENLDGDEPAELIVARSTAEYLVVNVPDPGDHL